MKAISKKLICEFICLLFIIIINFLLPRMMPGDAVLMLTGMDEEAITQAQYESYKVKLGLDKGYIEQFADYFKNLLHGDLGYSYHYNESVSSVLLKRIPNTLQIALPVFIISSLVAFFLGCYAGWKKGSICDNSITVGMIALDAIPGFLLALLLVSFFSYKLSLFPLGGLNSIWVPKGAWFTDRIWHLTLPVITLTLGSIPAKYLIVRNSVAAAKNEQYVTYALARGISERRIRLVHIGKNACQPFFAMLGINLGFILSGSMICENIFSIKGMGSLLHSSVLNRDFAVLQGCLLVSAIFVIAATMLSDILGVFLDPRIRRQQNEN